MLGDPRSSIPPSATAQLLALAGGGIRLADRAA
jgi:hypothetical protein